MIELSWHAGLDEAEIREVREVAGAAAAADATAPLSEHVLLHLRRGAEQAVHLLARADRTLVAVAHLDLPGVSTPDPAAPDPAAPDTAASDTAAPDPAADSTADADSGGAGELVVHPAHRRAGLGTHLVEQLVERVPAGGALQLWAHGEHPGAAAIAARLGFTRSRELWQMRRDVSGLPEPELPPGVRLRPFVVGADEAEFLRVNNAAFDWHPEQGGWGLDEVGLREAEPWFDPAGFLLAVDATTDRLLGYHWTKAHGDGLGEVYVLGVDPAARGRHLGTALTLAGLRHLRDRGLTEVMLYVEADNDAAVRVYRDLGFTRRHTDQLYVRRP